MITVKMDAERLNVRLGGILGAVKDLRPVWPDVHNIFMDFIKEVFRSQGGYAGTTWQPLNPNYAAWKARYYAGKPIMQLTGRLYESFITPNHPEHVYRTGPSFGEFGTRVLYARTHHWGYPPRNIPARRLIPRFTKAEGERVVDAILAHIIKGARKPGTKR